MIFNDHMVTRRLFNYGNFNIFGVQSTLLILLLSETNTNLTLYGFSFQDFEYISLFNTSNKYYFLTTSGGLLIQISDCYRILGLDLKLLISVESTD